jgi:hypothetical protein
MNDGANPYSDTATTTEAGQMATFTPANATGMPVGCTDATCLGAVTFSSSVDLAGVYVEHNTVDDPAQILLSTRGFTPGDYGTTVMIPAVKSLWAGRTTGIQIMNVGSAAADIVVTLAYQDGSATGAADATVTFEDVAIGASVTYFPGNHTADDTLGGPFNGGPNNEFLGSATITSDEAMVAIVNENDFAAAATTKQTVYAGFASTAGTDTVLYPLAKEFYNGNTTGLQVMNIGADMVTLEAEYICLNAAAESSSFTVDADGSGNDIEVASGASFTFWGVTATWWDGGVHNGNTAVYCAVTVNATGTGETSIVGIAQEAEYPAGGLGNLDTKNYEGFNQ